ncbi:hypothetical protein VPNG_03507 [Cytospora leucostoma]|uniref:AA1-like domain-containing protein n=1 Tax=Cytospora leucostoma TaxID=1230097 RepID=A0A423XCK5_9PEZI|nr:hypothetical protein VPNG_03507 [Cytospora leucostoma]
MPSHPPTVPLLLILLALSATPAPAMTPTNGVQFLFPTQGAALHYDDYVQVQYTSNFSAPWLFTFCEAADGGAVNEKQHQGVGGFNSTAVVKLDWPGADTPCWFDLKPDSSAADGSGANTRCGDDGGFGSVVIIVIVIVIVIVVVVVVVNAVVVERH